MERGDGGPPVSDAVEEGYKEVQVPDWSVIIESRPLFTGSTRENAEGDGLPVIISGKEAACIAALDYRGFGEFLE